MRLAHLTGDAAVSPGAARLLSAWHCDHADAGALTIAFGERAVRCLRGWSKHRRILSFSKVGTAESGAWLLVSDWGSAPVSCQLGPGSWFLADQ
jgi:hypothetical protein